MSDMARCTQFTIVVAAGLGGPVILRVEVAIIILYYALLIIFVQASTKGMMILNNHGQI
jgi:hypothetical protein